MNFLINFDMLMSTLATLMDIIFDKFTTALTDFDSDG